MVDPFVKVIRLGCLAGYDLFCKVEYRGEPGKRVLSFTGVIGPTSGGNARGACGQIIMEFREFDSRGWTTLDGIALVEPWTRELVEKFFRCWNRWHLNDMRAGSPAQMEWLRRNPVSGKDHYKAACEALAKAGLNPDPGYLVPVKDCLELQQPYSYGHAWLHEEIPEEVVLFVKGLPDSDKVPAWI